jgi:hypothetical protein
VLIDVFNNREKAVAIWALLVLGLAFNKNGRDIGASLYATLRALLQPKLLLLFAAAAAYSTIVTLAGAKVGLWHLDDLKETVYWFIGTGAIFVGQAVGSPNDPALVRKVIRRTLRFTVLLEFFVNLFVFPLWAEILLVPVVFLLVAMQAVASGDANLDAAKPVIDSALGVVSIVLLAWAIFSVGHDVHAFLSRHTVERLWVPAGLSLALIPFLHAAARYSQWELTRVRAQFADVG